ncbi:hypothetical protein COCON_G00125180 [Conger conger]|uniref:SRCR domain-containing protein n=1 Tax=Conger conger TaxID=82655 RepID=A0A9Q1DCV4_CONCO|nr:hypothetical protein COCON_G00125180 [Conger conger]
MCLIAVGTRHGSHSVRFPLGAELRAHVNKRLESSAMALFCPLWTVILGVHTEVGWLERVSVGAQWREVYYQETWSRVGGSWSSREASVACRQLGCGSAVQVYSSSPSGTGASDVCLTGFECSGRESHLVNCSTPHNLTCSSRERVSIVCSRNGPVWLDEVGCVGNETSLWDCPTAGWGQTDCGHKEDVGVVCSEFKEMRLSEGCSGNLEVFYNGTWGNVCWNGMEEDTATLICQELNCGNTSKVSQTGPRVESAPNWLDHVQCRPHDSTLWQCPSAPWGENKCDKTVAVLNCAAEVDENVPRSKLSCSSAKNQRPCTNHWPLRVVGGAGGCSGRLEVFHGGSWRSVCGDSWDMMDARVVCRQLGCVLAQGAHGNATFGTGNGTLWLTEVNCRGTELHLWDCPHSVHSSCRSQNQAGVTCTAVTTPTPPKPPPPVSKSPVSTPPKPPVPKPPPPLPSGLSIPAVAFLVMGALSFLLLVLLGVLLLQNRDLRRALSQWDHARLLEPIYEEIKYNLESGGNGQRPPVGTHPVLFTGRSLSEDPPSGYEDVGDGKGHSLSGDLVMEDAAESYDDVITAVDAHPDSVAGELAEGDAPEYYDDVITTQQSPEAFSAASGMDYDDVGEEPPETAF